MATAVVPHWLGEGSQGSVRGLGGWPVVVRDAGGGWKQWRYLSSVALARRNIRQDKLRDLPGSWTFLANCIRISTLHPTGCLFSAPPPAPAAPMELELTRINHLRAALYGYARALAVFPFHEVKISFSTIQQCYSIINIHIFFNLLQ